MVEKGQRRRKLGKGLGEQTIKEIDNELQRGSWVHAEREVFPGYDSLSVRRPGWPIPDQGLIERTRSKKEKKKKT